MHGLIFYSLKNFVEQKSSPTVWTETCNSIHSTPQAFDHSQNYEDEHFTHVLREIAHRLNLSESEFLEQFGEYLISDLIRTYKHWIMTEWDCLEFLLNVEVVMHTVARATAKSQESTPHPPILAGKRINSNEIILNYISSRKLCSLAKGLLIGAGHYYKEKLEVIELSCVKKGAESCLFKVIRLPTE